MNSAQVKQIKVSVCCVTFNHETYIRNCLEGFVMQHTDFGFEVIVHDDASTDETANIIREFEAKYPHLFRCIYQSDNQFLKQNVLTKLMLPKCSGKYVAICEGDDYWTDPLKLQKQVDLLERNPAASFSFSKVDLLFEKGAFDHSYNHMNNYPSVISLDDYLNFYYPIPMLTKVFRKSFLTDYTTPEWSWLVNVRFMDNVMHMCDLMKGPALFLNEITGTYRIQAQSVTRTAPKDDRWHNEEILLTHYHFIDLCPPELIDRYISIRAYHFEKLLNASIARKSLVQLLKDMLWYFTDSRSGSVIQKVNSVKKLFLTHSRSRSKK